MGIGFSLAKTQASLHPQGSSENTNMQWMRDEAKEECVDTLFPFGNNCSVSMNSSF
jgi:hypothetical protein